jgi:carboxypeptidase family protein
MGMTRKLGILGAVLIVFIAGCHTGRPVIDRSHRDRTAHGTIGGILQAQGGGSPLAGRQVEAIDTISNARFSAITNVTGGFSIEVPPGKYRLKVQLLDGEAVVKQPGTIDIEPSDLDANIEVEVGPLRS